MNTSDLRCWGNYHIAAKNDNFSVIYYVRFLQLMRQYPKYKSLQKTFAILPFRGNMQKCPKRESRKKIRREETIEERDLRRSKDNAIHKKNYPKRKALMSKEEADRKKIRQAAACKRWRTKQKALASGSSNALAASSSVPVATPDIPRTPQQLPKPLNAHSMMVSEINRAR